MCIKQKSNETFFYVKEVYIIKTYKEAFSLATIICLVTKVKLEMLQNLKFYSKSLAMSWQLTIQLFWGGVLQKRALFFGGETWTQNFGGNLPSALRAVLKTEVIVLRRENISPHERIGGGTLGAQYFTIYKWLWVYIWALTQKLGVFLRTNIHRN